MKKKPNSENRRALARGHARKANQPANTMPGSGKLKGFPQQEQPKNPPQTKQVGSVATRWRTRAWMVVKWILASLGIGGCVSLILFLMNASHAWTVGMPNAGVRPENPFIYSIPIEQSWQLPVYNVSLACGSIAKHDSLAIPGLIAGSLEKLTKPLLRRVWNSKDAVDFICQPELVWFKAYNTPAPRDSAPVPPSQEEWDKFYGEVCIRINIKWSALGVVPMEKDFWFYGARRPDGGFSWRRAIDRNSVLSMSRNDGFISAKPLTGSR